MLVLSKHCSLHFFQFQQDSSIFLTEVEGELNFLDLAEFLKKLASNGFFFFILNGKKFKSPRFLQTDPKAAD